MSLDMPAAAVPSTVQEALDYPEPERRQLRIFALDPLVARLSQESTCTLSVPYEPLGPGPEGELLRVVDYDSARNCYYEPVALDDRRLVASDGLSPSEKDPRFHQQMVYAVSSALLESFERSLGRRFRWRGADRLLLVPHAFPGRNARFDPAGDGSVQFGYFSADQRQPGRNLPGQTVFSCLSHDVIVHEVAHALVHRSRPHYTLASNVDVYAFHEAFADLLALFQHFTLPGLLEDTLAQNRTELATPGPFVSLAQQFGESNGSGRALRSALDSSPSPEQLARELEPHRRGAVLVAGVFDGFFTTYRRRVADLLRIATGGSGVLPQGAVHPDLVRRLASEARSVAARYLRMCIRSFQYLPVVDVTFGDFLRALVTADVDVSPEDVDGARAALVEGCRQRGIYPSDIGSLVVDSVAYPDAGPRGLAPMPRQAVEYLTVAEALRFARQDDQLLDEAEKRVHARAYGALHGWADRQRERLDLVADVPLEVVGFHAAFRQTGRGALHVDVIARFVQKAQDLAAAHGDALGGIALLGGTTVVADLAGHVRRVVSKPLPVTAGSGELAERGRARLAATLSFVEAFDGHYTTGSWSDAADRVVRTLNFASVDGAP